MPDKFTELTPALHDYLVAHSGPPDDLLERLAAETEAATDRAIMQIAPGHGAVRLPRAAALPLATRTLGSAGTVGRPPLAGLSESPGSLGVLTTGGRVTDGESPQTPADAPFSASRWERS